jgi:hypothetical protein
MNWGSYPATNAHGVFQQLVDQQGLTEQFLVESAGTRLCSAILYTGDGL